MSRYVAEFGESPSKPGPPASCTCGICRTCQMRRAGARYYVRNRSLVIQKNAEQKRARNKRDMPRPTANGRGGTDSQMDERARAWLRSIGVNR